MAKKNNKGFSLIEIIVAIAILTLLLTPIMNQLAQSMRTSRKAKEQQYVNESAVYELEYFQKTSIDDLKIEYAPGLVSNKKECTIYSYTKPVYDGSGNMISGASFNSTPIGIVEYNADVYDLGDVELGSENGVYNKQVVLDDLSNKVRAYVDASSKSYKICYEITKDDATSEMLSKFKLTNEGSMVNYDADGFVTEIVCVEAETMDDPNEVNLGNMQDLDVDTVAIIPGSASNFDSQAETKFYSMAMDRLRDLDYESWQQAILHTSSESVLTQYDYGASISKLTKIYVDELTDAEGKDYFLVKVDIYYNNGYKLVVNGDEHHFGNDISYNVFSQKFYTDVCPDIYFEYQPYTSDMYGNAVDGYTVTYASDDYIMIDNFVRDAKLYLYKPYNDQLNTSIGVKEEDYENNSIYTYYTDSTKSEVVDINLCYSSTTAAYLGGGMKIFTNLDTEEYDSPKESQFNCDFSKFDSKFTNVKSDREDASIFRDPFVRKKDNVYGETVTYLNSLNEDKRYRDRLYTITVTLTPADSGSNTVSLTGAKGEN